MEKIKIIGIDPSLRATGIAALTYDNEKKILTPPHDCQVLVNPAKFTGKDAILNMLEMMRDAFDSNENYQTADAYIIESPAVMFNKAWSSGTMALIAHISGGAAVIFGIEKVHLFRPNEWNRNRKKEVTHAKTIKEIGDPEHWDFCETLKSDKYIEHVLDAASMALFWIKHQYWEEDEESVE